LHQVARRLKRLRPDANVSSTPARGEEIDENGR
jgi:hypothetical protein